MKIRAIDYGSAPGFRKYATDLYEKTSATQPSINTVWLCISSTASQKNAGYDIVQQIWVIG